ncbi:MAG TPA: hypothetical protein VMY05_01615 [Acidobacteriota bacterium]|nr:hypothetical protein [Acidobacteriota bacterium]
MVETCLKTSRWLFTLVALALLTAASGCNDSPVKTDEETYGISGALVVDPNLASNPISKSLKVVVRLERGEHIVTTGQVSLAGRTLPFEACEQCLDSAYWLMTDSPYVFTDSLLPLEVQDGTELAYATTVNVADSFTITNVVPTNRLIQGNDQASLEWSTSNRAEVFVIAAVLSDSVYTGYGFSKYADDQTIPPEAFALSGGVEPDTGLYNLYVYALTGTPDSSLTSGLLPVPLPDQRPDNISLPELSGKFGTIVVTLFDTLRVAQQP